ncbi:MAG: hypothetical protein ACFFDK_06515 [Promethearchaeota archaeon]
MSKKKKRISEETETEEYGIVLKKRKKYRHRIFPQKGKKPRETDDYKVV